MFLEEDIRSLHEPKYREYTDIEISRLLNEERHYPDFLDSFRLSIWLNFQKECEKRIGRGEKLFSFSITPPENEMCDEIRFNVKCFRKNDDVDGNGDITYTNKLFLKDGKVDCPEISAVIPIDGKNRPEMDFVAGAISHELMHLHDDWVRMMNGKIPLYHSKEQSMLSAIKRLYDENGIGIAKPLFFAVYLSLCYEQTAYLSQTMEELKSLGAARENFKERMRRTTAYVNFSKTEETLKELVDYSSGPDVAIAFNILYKNRKALRLFAKTKPEKLDVEGMKKDIQTWFGWIRENFLKKFYSVVGLYLDRVDEKNKRFFF